MRSATNTMVSIFGALIGLAGMEHGIGEILQGDIAPGSVMILSWPESPFFRILNGEPAMTLIPNLLFTGILAVIVSLVFMVWAVWYAQRKHGGLVLILLSLLMLLVGGGIFPPVLGIVTGAAATRMHAPLGWWSAHLPQGARRFLAALWPWSLGACLLAWLGMIPGVPALNFFFGIDNPDLIWDLLACMFGFLILSGIAGFARDSGGQIRNES